MKLNGSRRSHPHLDKRREAGGCFFFLLGTWVGRRARGGSREDAALEAYLTLDDVRSTVTCLR